MPRRGKGNPERIESCAGNMTPSEKRRRKKVRNAFGVLAAVLSLVAAVIIAIAPWEAGNYDPSSLCPKNGDYSRTAVLVDATDSLSESQVKTVAEEINFLRDRLALHEWVGIFVLNEDNLTLPAPEIALCYPGDRTTANPWIRNPALIQQKFEKHFSVRWNSRFSGWQKRRHRRLRRFTR